MLWVQPESVMFWNLKNAKEKPEDLDETLL